MHCFLWSDLVCVREGFLPGFSKSISSSVWAWAAGRNSVCRNRPGEEPGKVSLCLLRKGAFGSSLL